MQALRKRVQESYQRALSDPTRKLGRQTESALTILQTGKMISQLKKACQMLFVSTQISKTCCEAFTQAGAFNILFDLLKSCNRSTPHQELLRLALIVLLNAGRHMHLAPVMSTAPEATEILLDLLQTFRDKKPIFVLSTELLCRLVHCSPAIKEQCNSPLYRKRIDAIHAIVKRKQGSTTAHSEIQGFERYVAGKAYDSIEPLHVLEHLRCLLGQR